MIRNGGTTGSRLTWSSLKWGIRGQGREARQPAPAPSTSGPLARVVAIGASAGGLEALQEFWPHLVAGRLAVVVAQHLAPEHRSLIVDLLARVTSLAVVEVVDGSASRRT